jgi:two-component system phosphate regulon sensor histidine kinase PhoR
MLQTGSGEEIGHTREHNSLAVSLNSTLAENEELISDLSRSDSRNSAILFSMTEGVAVVSKSGSVLLINDSFRTLFDIRSSEKEIPGEVAALFSRNDVAGQIRFEDRRIAYSMAPVEGSGDSVFSFRDITREVQLSEMKRNFAINVSHELRTPLTAIKGYAETLQEDIEGEGSRYLDVILRNTDRLISIVTDIQTLSEVESTNEFIKLESVPVDEIVNTVMPLFSSMAEEKGLILSFIQEKPRISINADRYRIEQVFVNLIDNAVKYTDSGTVEVRASTRGELAVFTVSDTGRGIPGEALGRIFERFFVVDRSRSRSLGGTGLGLSIVKHIIEVHGGTISVSSTPGRGSIFLFTLPLAE